MTDKDTSSAEATSLQIRQRAVFLSDGTPSGTIGIYQYHGKDYATFVKVDLKSKIFTFVDPPRVFMENRQLLIDIALSLYQQEVVLVLQPFFLPEAMIVPLPTPRTIN